MSLNRSDFQRTGKDLICISSFTFLYYDIIIMLCPVGIIKVLIAAVQYYIDVRFYFTNVEILSCKKSSEIHLLRTTINRCSAAGFLTIE